MGCSGLYWAVLGCYMLHGENTWVRCAFGIFFFAVLQEFCLTSSSIIIYILPNNDYQSQISSDRKEGLLTITKRRRRVVQRRDLKDSIFNFLKLKKNILNVKKRRYLNCYCCKCFCYCCCFVTKNEYPPT